MGFQYNYKYTNHITGEINRGETQQNDCQNKPFILPESEFNI